MYILTSKISFPPVETADENGFLAIGGDLGAERLLEAYRRGIFPWYNEEDPICWWSPDPRFVLFPDQLHVSRSMKHVISSNQFSFTVNHAFEQVIRACSAVKRKEANGTWINEEMIEAYTTLHKLGHALSAETWYNGKLVGGLYGVKMGKIFFGESMFSIMTNASKFAFIELVHQLQAEDIKLVDCQMHTSHLESLGAMMITREEYCRLLKALI
ncbi:MAG: leucyl/phenylalanyl-tRNA--protein transferase [Ferruginibacter sp.]